MLPFTAGYKKYTLNFKKPAGTSRGFLRQKTVYFIYLTDRANPERVGVGECAPWKGLSLDDRPDFEAQLAQICQNLNAGAAPESLNLSDFPALAFGLEMALLDWRGGGQRLLFENDFSLGRQSLPTHGLIWMGSGSEVLQQAQRKAAQGFACLKMKVGALEFEEELRLLAELRRAYPAGQIELRLDANGAFSPDKALERLKALAQFDIFAIEQPIKPGQWPKMADLCANSPIPIALDEDLIGHRSRAEKESLLKAVKPQYLVLKPMLLGGFAAAEEWIEAAEKMGIGWWVNSALESNIGLNALCQWTAQRKPNFIHGLGTGQLYRNNVPSPVRLAGAKLVCNLDERWDREIIAR